jgi:hypothetical protein
MFILTEQHQTTWEGVYFQVHFRARFLFVSSLLLHVLEYLKITLKLLEQELKPNNIKYGSCAAGSRFVKCIHKEMNPTGSLYR